MTSDAVPVRRATHLSTWVEARPAARARVAFIDNLRILLVILVIVHHLAVTYGGEGSWYYIEGQSDVITTTVLTLFVAVNQAFFMGFYFLLAGYFVPRSLDRSGSARFLRGRLLRLGVPLVLQVLVIGPLLAFGLRLSLSGFEGSLWEHLALHWRHCRGLDTGPLWFVEALLIFSVLYALWWRVRKPPAGRVQSKEGAPGNVAIAVFALAVGLVTFTVRIWLPVGWWFVPLNFQFPHFPQYVALFIVGTVAYRRDWLSAISADRARGRLWGRVVVFLLALAPVLFVVGGALEGSTEAFRGGIRWQALAYALWEQFLCVGVVISLLVWFRRRYDYQRGVARMLSANAYAVYVIHAPILVFVCLGLGGIELYPLLKFALASVICIPLAFLVGRLVRMLPGARRTL